MLGKDSIVKERLRNTSLLAFAGIGNPGQFFSLLRESQFSISECCAFRDHHRYTSKDISRLKALCRRAGIEAMITTEKDAERFRVQNFEPFPVLVARLEFEFDNPDKLLQLILTKTGSPIETGILP